MDDKTQKNELPKLVNLPFEIQIGELKLMVKRAGIKDLALMQSYIGGLESKGDLGTDFKVLVYALFLCSQKVYPDMNEDYLNDNLPASLFLEKPEMGKEILQRLGFLKPPKEGEK